MRDSSWHARQRALARAWVGDATLELPPLPHPGTDPDARARSRATADRAIATAQYPPQGPLPKLEGAAAPLLLTLVEARSQVFAARAMPGLRRNLIVWHRTALQDTTVSPSLGSELFLMACTEFTSASPSRAAGLRRVFEALESWEAFLEAAEPLARSVAGEDRGPTDPQPPRNAEPEFEPESEASQRLGPDLAVPTMTPEPGPEPRYRIYSRADDEVTTPARLVPPARARELRRVLDGASSGLTPVERSRWRALQRRLRARGRPRWVFAQPEGTLDTARIARVVVQPSDPLAFKREQEGPRRPATVSLLIDSSRSMAGPKLQAAAVAVDLLASSLEAASIPVEVLGYTTRDWKGGQPRRRWEAEGRPPRPGRLCALRHVVYKAADTPLLRARPLFGVLLERSLLKENVDGEALWWAYQRLLRRPGRRVLVVVSDGAPECEATRRANAASYLTRHLRDVIETIESHRRVELFALGLDRRASRLYSRHVFVDSATNIGEALRRLTHELVSGAASPHPRAAHRVGSGTYP
ncbi:MAG: hypothetical protein AAF799_35275 [Myxococcota bacterium]